MRVILLLWRFVVLFVCVVMLWLSWLLYFSVLFSCWLGLDCLVICGFEFSFVVTIIVLLFEDVIN